MVAVVAVVVVMVPAAAATVAAVMLAMVATAAALVPRPSPRPQVAEVTEDLGPLVVCMASSRL